MTDVESCYITGVNKIHLDTDLGGDIGDLCTLALLLRWPGGIDLTGITTVGVDEGGEACRLSEPK